MALYFKTETDEKGLIKELRLYRRRTKMDEKVLLLGNICSVYLREDFVYGAEFVVFSGDVIISNVSSMEVSQRHGVTRLDLYTHDNTMTCSVQISLPKTIAKKTIGELKETLNSMLNDKETYKVLLNAKERLNHNE